MTNHEQKARELAERCARNWIPQKPLVVDGTAFTTKEDIDESSLELTNHILRSLNLPKLVEDGAMVDWLEKSRSSHFGHWADFGEWENPSVDWHVRSSVKCGTYEFPKELSELTVRTAIRNAMKESEE